MLRLACLSLCLVVTGAPVAPAEGPVLGEKGTKTLAPLVSGLTAPRGVCVGPGGHVYVTQSDGSVAVVKNGKASIFAKGMSQPRGIASWNNLLFVADGDRVWRVDAKGKAEVFVDAKAFPAPVKALTDIEISPQAGWLYVSDAGDGDTPGAIYRVSQQRRVVFTHDGRKGKGLPNPTALRLITEYHLHATDHAGALVTVRRNDSRVTKVSADLGKPRGLTYDHYGRLYVSDADGKVFVLARPDQKPVVLASGFGAPGDLCLSADGKSVLVPDGKAGTLTAVPCTVPGQEIDESKLAVEIVPAFEDVEWTGWKKETASGLPIPHRPLVLTHSNDGSGRTFVATQQGVIHILPKKDGKDGAAARKTKVFLDIESLVSYKDNENEEGFLGLAFSPKFKEDGALYVYYTPRRQKNVNLLSRFRVSKDDPDRADPKSEEVLMTYKKPFWNHDGGTIAFGPDGYLYVAIGDGGAANDPFNNGQNLSSWLGKVLRIDVSKKGEGGLPYAIPKDNPFVGRKDAKPEIYAYGFRNIWRMAFDRKTGVLWAADVGQNLWEEINLVTKGGNYGWRPREGLHPFGSDGVEANEKMIEPIWEYHHDIGKSITGGNVYRGKKVPELEGKYVYADYVSGHVWALSYDEKQKRVTGHHLLRRGGFPVFTFGEDADGETYLLTSTPSGKGIFAFRSKSGKSSGAAR